jgi:SAM-dependent methyltransferase
MFIHMSVQSGVPFYNLLAPQYDQLFEEPHRRAYDLLAWEIVERLLPATPCTVLDVGCGTGRWAQRLLDRGHEVLGIEPSAAMVRLAEERTPDRRFRIINSTAEDAELDDMTADLVIAMGSLQYTADPGQTLRRLAKWTRIGGRVVVLVDSLVGLVMELFQTGRTDEALDRLHTRRAQWAYGEQSVSYHLLDRATLERLFRDAGLADVACRGLLVGASLLGRQNLVRLLNEDWERRVDEERCLSLHPALADSGKHLVGVGQRVSR